MPDLSIVICTFERLPLLANALGAVAALDGLAGAPVEVIVVDNSPRESARAAVQAAGRDFPVPLRYVAARPANIAVARNAGAAAAGGAFVAFLDDDQEVSRGWLGAVLGAARQQPHDILFGAVLPRFAEPSSENEPARAMFSRVCAAPTGTPVLARRRTHPFVPGTGNSVFRRSTALAAPHPFDPRFGECGGEDLHLFLRLERDGRRFAWLSGAEVVEVVPAQRCTRDYLATRHFAGGQAYAAAMIDTSPAPALSALRIELSGRAQLAALALAGLLRPGDEAEETVRTLRIAGARGKLARRSLLPLYRVERRQDAAPEPA
ncbi:MAG: glycosyltransferase family 2 protein [Methylobacterium frigidaeris]